jgi:cytochrome c oxidase assembly factor CtaG
MAEQTAFLVSGLLVWISVFGGDPAQRHTRIASGIAALLLTSMHMTLLGALLALAPGLSMNTPALRRTSRRWKTSTWVAR